MTIEAKEPANSERPRWLTHPLLLGRSFLSLSLDLPQPEPPSSLNHCCAYQCPTCRILALTSGPAAVSHGRTTNIPGVTVNLYRRRRVRVRQAPWSRYVTTVEGYLIRSPRYQGAYGTVVATKHKITGDGCAIKKITHINTKVRFIAPYLTLIDHLIFRQYL